MSLAGVLLLAGVVAADTPTASRGSQEASDVTVELPSSGTVTPEMWFYLQEYQRHKNPKEALRRKAEARSQQRQNRLAAQRWFGISNLRPMANPVPYYATYSPTWVGSSWNPYAWSGYGSGAQFYLNFAR
jgi:hypothetical protein